MIELDLNRKCSTWERKSSKDLGVCAILALTSGAGKSGQPLVKE